MNSAKEHLLDARGLLCPEPVMMLHKKMRLVQPGDTIRMLATDPSTERDIARFCEFLRHPLLAAEQHEGEFIYRIKKRDD